MAGNALSCSVASLGGEPRPECCSRKKPSLAFCQEFVTRLRLQAREVSPQGPALTLAALKLSGASVGREATCCFTFSCICP